MPCVIRGSRRGIEQVDGEVDEHEDGGRGHDYSLHHGNVLRHHRHLGEPSDTGAGEHGFDDHGSREQVADDDAGDRERRDARQLQGVSRLDAQRDAPFARAASMNGCRQVVCRLVASTCAITAPVGSASVIAGRITVSMP